MLNHPLIHKLKKFALDSLVRACNATLRSTKINQNPAFKKVECYDIKDADQKKKAIKFFYNLENENPEMKILSEPQRVFLLNYINKNIHDHLLGEYYLEEDKFKIFRKVQNGLEHNEKIQKTYIDFILSDIEKSFNRLGYSREEVHNEYDL
jgi:hypothetical protein